MHPSFFEADHRSVPHHPVPAGVRRVVRRNRPERLDLSVPPPGLPLEAFVPRRPELPIGPPLRVRLGRGLIRLGRWLAREAQPVAGAAGRG